MEYVQGYDEREDYDCLGVVEVDAEKRKLEHSSPSGRDVRAKLVPAASSTLPSTVVRAMQPTASNQPSNPIAPAPRNASESTQPLRPPPRLYAIPLARGILCGTPH